MQESSAELVASVVRAELAALEDTCAVREYRWSTEGPRQGPFS